MNPASKLSDSNDKSIIFRFKGKKLQGLKIPWSVLKSVGAKVIKLSQRIYSLDENKKSLKNFDYNFSMKSGSVQLSVSPIENDETGFEMLKKQATVWESLGNKGSENKYLADYQIRKEMSDFLVDTTSWAESIQFFPEGETGNFVELNESSVELLKRENEQEAFSEFICYVYSINIENHRLGLQRYDGKKISVNFNTVDAVNLRSYVKDFFYVKLINREKGKNPKVHTYKGIPYFDLEKFEISEDAISKEKEKLQEIFKLKDGWGGPETKKVDRSLIERAEKYIGYIAIFTKELGLKQVLPFIAPTASGKIQFEWESVDKSLEIEFNADGFTVLKSERNSSEEFVVDNFMKTLDSIRWVLAG